MSRSTPLPCSTVEDEAGSAIVHSDTPEVLSPTSLGQAEEEQHRNETETSVQHHASIASTSTEDNSTCTDQSENVVATQPSDIDSQERFRHWKTLVVDTWILEWTALVMSFVCLGAIWALLITFDGKALRDWHSHLSINTILSGLATVMRGFLLFTSAAALGQLKWIWFNLQTRPFKDFALYDQASRGLIGSVRLLYRLRLWHLASLGCAVTILALASDVFVQASVVTLKRDRLLLDVAQMPVCTVGEEEFTIWSTAEQGYLTLDERIKTAIDVGLAANAYAPTSIKHSTYCPSTRCDFPFVSSLGMCAQCTDRSDQIVVTHEMDSGTIRTVTATLLSAAGQNLTLRAVNSSMDWSNQNLDVGYLNITATEAHVGVGPDFKELPLATVDILGGSADLLGDTLQPWTKWIKADGGSSGLQWLYSAFQCSLSLCSRTEKSEVVNGAQILTDTKPDILTGTYFQRGEYLDFIFDGGANPPLQIATTDNDWISLANYLSGGILAGNVTGHVSGIMYTTSCSSDIMQALLDALTGNTAEGLLVDGEEISYGPPNIPTLFKDCATTVTNSMRAMMGLDYPVVRGSALGTETYTHVRWAYMLVPSLLVFLSAIFLTATVWQCERRGVPTWKSDVFAVVVHAAKLVEELPGPQPTKISELDEWAEGTEIMMKHGPKRQTPLTSKEI